MTWRLAYEMSSAVIVRAAAHRLRELGASQVKVTLTPTPETQGHTLSANVSDDDAAEAGRLIRGLDPSAVHIAPS